MTNVKGIAASSGYAIAKAYKLDMPDLTVTRTTVEDTEAEIALYNKSVAAVKLEIAAIKEAATKNLSEEEAAVFDAHAQILEDPELQSQVEAKINDEK
ncbi:MAG: phosphoenolpyruvate-utilizing N-terminal domain-containing protein, partial [Catenibacterium sp.]